MSFNWKETCLFQRNSNLYTFNKDRLFRKNEFTHIYMPWDDSIENELMYAVKADINSVGQAYIPLMNFKQNNYDLPKDELEKVMAQMDSSKGETHLIMSNFKSIHIFRVKTILDKSKVDAKKVNKLFGKKKFKTWIVVDDVFVLDVNHIGDEEGLQHRLTHFIEQDQTQHIFKVPHTELGKKSTKGFKWIESNRSLTYDYFIRSCELKDNIFQDAWDHLARSTQHHLITCELQRQQCVFYRDLEKWNHLKECFQAYKEGLKCELNEVYILPLVNSIGRFDSLREAWNIVKDGLVDARSVTMIESVLNEKASQVEDFLFFTKNAKSLFYSLKNHFSKKFHKEEYLLIENFLGRQESLVYGFQCKDLGTTVELITEIDQWIAKSDKNTGTIGADEFKNMNSKLSHLMSIMISASYNDNIFFKLLEEKMSKGTVQKSFADEVKELSSLNLKKSA